MSIFNISDENVGKIVSTLYMFIEGKYRKLCDEIVDIIKKGQINNLYVLNWATINDVGCFGTFTSIDAVNYFIDNTFPKGTRKIKNEVMESFIVYTNMDEGWLLVICEKVNINPEKEIHPHPFRYIEE